LLVSIKRLIDHHLISFSSILCSILHHLIVRFKTFIQYLLSFYISLQQQSDSQILTHYEHHLSSPHLHFNILDHCFHIIKTFIQYPLSFCISSKQQNDSHILTHCDHHLSSSIPHFDILNHLFHILSDYRYPSNCNALISSQEFDPDFIAAITTRELDSNLKHVVFDTGCTFAISPDITDFITYHTVPKTATIQTAGGPTKISGHGIVEWTLVSEDGNLIPLQVPCQHVPAAKMRLLSPQALCQLLDLDGSQDHFGGNSNHFWLHGSRDCKKRFQCSIDPRSNLPVALAKTRNNHMLTVPKQAIKLASPCISNPQCRSQSTTMNSTLTEENNQNLSPAQKELLLWHYCLGHLSFQHLQWLMRSREANPSTSLNNNLGHHSIIQCIHPKHPHASSCQPPMCTSCEIARAKRCSPHATSSKHNRELILRKNDLKPGNCVSIDQYESSIRGRIPNSKGKEPFGNKYTGGTIFYDHASGLIRCIHQVSLRASDTIIAKKIFEREAKL
jgi:hypothetical protein